MEEPVHAQESPTRAREFHKVMSQQCVMVHKLATETFIIQVRHETSEFTLNSLVHSY